jgi:hypothetical protein
VPLPKWIQGTLQDGRFICVSAKTRSWEKAETEARAMADISDSNKSKARERVRIEDAVQSFREDETSRHLSKDSQRKSEFFFGKQLKTWENEKGMFS